MSGWWRSVVCRLTPSGAERAPVRAAQVMNGDEEDAPVPPHVPFHVAVRMPPPACATLGLPPRLTEGTESAEGEPDEDDPTLVHRVDGRPASTTTWHAVVPDATTPHTRVNGSRQSSFQ